ncbi:MAG: phosphodiester glycosidase family protein [Flavobacteriales bacterium]|nr:phosphodiester glycosidase family protein [Flavobacteriales bacterium]
MLKNKLLTFVLAFAFCTFAYAEKSDSTVFAKAKWTTSKIDKGITLKQHHFTGSDSIFASVQYISVIIIDQKKAKGRFSLANNEGKITKTSTFAADKNAIVAINGTFYNMKPPYNSVCYYKADGVVFYDKIGSMAQRENGAVLIDDNGKMSVNAVKGDPTKWVTAQSATSVMCAGPVLLIEGKNAELFKNSFNNARHPRTAVGSNGDKVFLVAVDGRAKDNAAGMSLAELTKIMKWLGAEDALNLDGGGSTTMIVKGKSDSGVVNHPSDNGKFDNKGERSVVNAVLFNK